MLGLPTETEEDIEGIAVLSDKIAREYYTIPKDQRNGKVSIVSSTSFFVPKPFTPFQWTRMCTSEEFLEKQRFLNGKMKEQLNQKSIKYNWHEAELTQLEGVLARGDRKLSKVIYDAYKGGCMFDSWSEYFKYDVWMEMFQRNEIDPLFYTAREREENELAFSLETPYFGTKNAQTSQENLVETGRCFYRALYRYEKNRE